MNYPQGIQHMDFFPSDRMPAVCFNHFRRPDFVLDRVGIAMREGVTDPFLTHLG